MFPISRRYSSEGPVHSKHLKATPSVDHNENPRYVLTTAKTKRKEITETEIRIKFCLDSILCISEHKQMLKIQINFIT
jgi:hypothetical protein